VSRRKEKRSEVERKDTLYYEVTISQSSRICKPPSFRACVQLPIVSHIIKVLYQELTEFNK
jgi:hypothetical protein